MHTRRTLTLALGLLALIGALALAGAGGGGPTAIQAQEQDAYSTYYVAPAGTNCGGMTPCYDVVQDAVDAVDDPGDVVKIATGTYTDVNAYGGLAQVAYVDKSLTLRGGYTTSDWDTSDPGVHTTTLDAQGGGRVLYVAGSVSVTVEGLYLTGGEASGLGGDPFGDAGGGVYVYSATVTLRRNTIAGNEATVGFESDGLGGGVYADASVVALYENLILNNGADGGAFLGGGMGGGLYFIESQITLEGNQIRGNQARGTFGSGGGAEFDACANLSLVNNVVADNQANADGSGIYIGHMSGVPSTGQLVHSTIAGNQSTYGAGVGVAGGSVVTLTNTILMDHDTGIAVNFDSTATLTATLWGNTVDWAGAGTIYTGTLNYTGDPLFLDPAAGDYHIAGTSAARDRGVNAGVSVDLDGTPRDATPDLGAYEAGAQGVLLVRKEASVTFVNPGDEIVYIVVVTNAGPAGMTNVALVDDLPALQHPLNAVSDQGTCTVVDAGYGGQVTCDVGTLGGNQTAHITVTAQATTTVPATLPQAMRNTAQATSDQAQATAYADTVLQNCHACVDGALPRYDTVQAAVDAAGPGHEVWIAGTCVGATGRGGLFQQVYLDKDLTLRGGYNTDFTIWAPDLYPTTLDADGQGRVVYVAGSADVTLEALRLTGGDATGLGGEPTTLDDVGGGVYAVTAAVTLSDTLVVDNVASTSSNGFGGGVGVTTATLILVDATLEGNTASGADLGLGYGGGLYAGFSTVRLERSRLESNLAATTLVGTGGGAYLYECDLTGNATLWISNTVSLLEWGDGGGFYLEGSRPFALTNCVFVGNQAGSVFVDDEASTLYVDGTSGVLVHPTIAYNQSDWGVNVGSTVTTTVAITNAIVAGHDVGIQVSDSSTVTVNGVLWHANVSNTVGNALVSGEVSGDPAFGADGYHITAESAARDNGVVSGVPMDVDGEGRPRDAGYDLGADEYWLCTLVTGASISGPAGGDPGVDHAFSASVVPGGATGPIAYQWDNGDTTATSVRNLPSGIYTLVVTVTNCGGSGTATAEHVVTIYHKLYLPLAMRGYQQ